MCLTTSISADRLLRGTMTHSPPATLAISELRNSSGNIIGGRDCQHSSRTMCMAAEYVNNTRSIATPPTLHSSRSKPWTHAPSPSSRWISSPIFRSPTAMTLFWSWSTMGLQRGVILEPCNKTIDAMGTAKILLNSLYKRYGLPDKAVSDRGPQFASQAFRELGRLLGIKLAMSTAHHPQTDGATETANQEIEAYLSIFCGNH